MPCLLIAGISIRQNSICDSPRCWRWHFSAHVALLEFHRGIEFQSAGKQWNVVLYSNERKEEEEKKHVSMRLACCHCFSHQVEFFWLTWNRKCHIDEGSIWPNITSPLVLFPRFVFRLCSKSKAEKNALNYHLISQFIIFCKNISDGSHICLFFVYLPLEDILTRRLKGGDTIACNSTFTKKGLCTKAQIFRDSFFIFIFVAFFQTSLNPRFSFPSLSSG